MKHIGRITVVKPADHHTDDVNAVLDRIFGFVLDLVDVKGKGGHTTTS